MDAIDKINVFLAQKGMTGADLERQIGVSNSVYSQWNTKSTKPSKKSLLKVADVLGVDVSELLPDKQEKATAEVGSGIDEKYVKYLNFILDASERDLAIIDAMIEAKKKEGK